MADIPESLPLAEEQSAERLQAAVILGHAGTWESVVRRIATLRRDWRDGLVAAGSENGDWPGCSTTSSGLPEPTLVLLGAGRRA